MADTKISALSAVTAGAGAQELAVNDAGTSKKITLTQVQTFLRPLFAYTTSSAQTSLVAGTDNSGLTVTVVSGKTYRLRAAGTFRSAATATGWSIRPGGTATASFVRVGGATLAGTTPANYAFYQYTGLGTAYTFSTGVTAANTDYPWFLDGIITTSGAGTVLLGFASEVGGSTVTLNAGAFLELLEVA